ncbi:MAG: hypothetical protein ACYC27_07370 [Armatimonadota bacterium]
MKNIPLSIADISIVMRQAIFPSKIHLPISFNAFLTDTAPDSPDIQVDWHESSEYPPLPEDDFLYDPGAACRIYSHPEKSAYIVNMFDATGYFPRSRMTVSTDWSSAVLYEDPIDTIWPDEVFFGVSELLIRSRLPFHNGVLFHSSGIDDNGNGIMFVAFSGTGKSTQARIWSQEPGVTLINHDRMAVRIKDDKVIAYGVPWGGSGGITLNRSVPLRAVILLEQAPVNELIPLKPIEALPQLMTCSYPPYWSSSEIDRQVEVIESVITRVPVFRLRCRPEPAVIPLVRSAISSDYTKVSR